ncbi:hypothetical protein OE88DRAFT_1628258 [Heliocybe sulcata]|uniref:GST N-terminal domain-containing protein n=1 Tax=Heliocybe sulcata TaxID=5364 RepID=A0A5C3N7B6_9AGAM|nr:hypothetical protein OE88DRAFT_1628258 [Heliocybe sulcata]
MSEIVLYDIPRKDLESGPWSPNTLKTRQALKFKGLPYKTVWVEYPDIASVCQKIGATSTKTTPDGNPLYTVPTIYDPATERAVSDSYTITEYLDATYPSTPRLIPVGTEGLQAAFYAAFQDAGFFKLIPAFAPLIGTLLNPPSAEYFYGNTGRKEALAPWRPEDPNRDEFIQAGKQGFDVIAGWYEKAGEGKLFIMGDTPSWADIVVASYFASVRNIFGRNSKEWKEITTWHDGRWEKLLAVLDE